MTAGFFGINAFLLNNTMTSYLFTPPAVQSLPIRGKTERFPINRIFCVGRNYHAHAVEMGRPVDKSVEQAFYFTKSPQTRWARPRLRSGSSSRTRWPAS